MIELLTLYSTSECESGAADTSLHRTGEEGAAGAALPAVA